MSREINHRYLKDINEETYFPITHINAVIGIEELKDVLDSDNNNNKVDINRLRANLATLEIKNKNDVEDVKKSITELNENIVPQLETLSEKIDSFIIDVEEIKLEVEILKENAIDNTSNEEEK